MKDHTQKLLVKAERSIRAASLLLDGKEIDFAAGRAYYAMFYVAEALLYEKDLAFSKHSGVHAAYGREFAKTGLLDVKYHKWLLKAFNDRLQVDYEVDTNISKADVEVTLDRAQEFLDAARCFLERTAYPFPGSLSGAKIFISYAHGDAQDLAKRLFDWLKDRRYQPWLDKSGISAGGLTTQLEQALKGCELVIPLLSPMSVRPDSFLRNETLQARRLGKKILPVKIADVDLPVHLEDYQIVDVSDNPEKIFSELSKYLPDPPPGRALWPSQPNLDFTQDIERHRGLFIGREWLFEKIRDWTRNERSRVLLLTADTGVGKTCLAANMSHHLNVCGVYFCNRTTNAETCKTAVWVAELSRQLAARFPAYYDSLPHQTEPDWGHPELLFRKLIVDPLLACKNKLDPKEKWVFVVDGLDETFDEKDPTREPQLAGLLARFADHLPAWLRVVATSRPSLAILRALKIDGVKRQHIAADGEENRSDLRTYVSHRLCGMASRDDALPQIVGASQGNFLFARIVLDELEKGTSAPLQKVIETPALSNLTGLYLVMFSSRFHDMSKYREQIRPLLDCLVATCGPLPKSLLYRACGMSRNRATESLTILSEFFSLAEDAVALFHKSLRDWLLDHEASQRFAADLKSGHEKLAEVCLKEYENHKKHEREISSYSLFYATDHLKAAGKGEELNRLLRDYEFLVYRLKRGRVHSLVSDLNRCFGGEYEKWPQELLTSLKRASSIPVQIFIAEIHDMAGRSEEATAICERLLKDVHPDEALDYGIHVKLATYLDHCKMYERSLEVLNEFLEASARREKHGVLYWWARYHRGITNRRLERYASAIGEFVQIRQQPHWELHRLGALHQLAVVELLIGHVSDLADVEEKFHQCLQERGDDDYNHRRAYEHRRLGQLYALDKGRLDEAAIELEKARVISEKCSHKRFLKEISRDLIAFVRIPEHLRKEQPREVFLTELAGKFELATTHLSASFRVVQAMRHGYLEIFDEKKKAPSGFAVAWEHAHEQALLHAAVAVLIVDEQGRVAIQRRQEDDSRGKWDVSAAGHLEVGETPELSAIRETYEEIGVLVDRHLLRPLGEAWEFSKEGGESVTEAEEGHRGPLHYIYRRRAKNREVMSVFLSRMPGFHKDRNVEIQWMDVDSAGREADLHPENYASTFKHLFGHPETRHRLQQAMRILAG